MTEHFKKIVLNTIFEKLGITEKKLADYLLDKKQGNKPDDDRFKLLELYDAYYFESLFGYDGEASFESEDTGFLESKYGRETRDLVKSLGFYLDLDKNDCVHGHDENGVYYLERADEK